MKKTHSSIEYVTELLEWSAESLQNLGLAIAGVLFVMFLGYLLCVTVPKRTVESASISAQSEIKLADTQNTSSSQRLSAEERWYTYSYTNGLGDIVRQSNESLKIAQDSYDDINRSFNADRKLAAAQKARASAEESLKYSQLVISKLDANKKLRDEAIAQRDTIGKSIEDAGELARIVNQRFDNEEGQYHPKYTGPLAGKLEEAGSTLPVAQNYWGLGVASLPDLSDSSHLGDPNRAKLEFDKAKSEVDTVNSLMSYVTTQLDYQAEAKANATSRTQEASSTYAASIKYVDGIKNSTGYWLMTAYGDLASSQQQLNLASFTLTQLLDGYIDYPVSYEAAKESLSLSQRATQDADEEVIVAHKAVNSLQTLTSELDSTQNAVANANGYYSTLQADHDISTWAGVASNLQNANSFISSAQTKQSSASKNSSLSVQKFADSYREAQSALDDLSQAKMLAQQVVDKANYLEGFRSEWPNAQSRAQGTIDSERPNVTQYGSYSYGAQSDFNTAVSLLEQAVSEAFGLRYEPAVDKANQATTMASGTGNRAYRGYQDYVEEQERQQRQREEEARRQQEESSSPSYSSPSFDSGSNNTDYGGGGGYGGSSDYGGGSDSNFGGGSDSDW